MQVGDSAQGLITPKGPGWLLLSTVAWTGSENPYRSREGCLGASPVDLQKEGAVGGGMWAWGAVVPSRQCS